MTTRLREVARIPLPQAPFEWSVLPELDLVLFMREREYVAHSLHDGRELWRKSARWQPVRLLGAGSGVLVVQELRRMGSNRWIEGVDATTGETRWFNPESAPVWGNGLAIAGALFAPVPDGSLRIDLETGACQPVDAVPWRAGPGGWYGLRKGRLMRFDGTSSQAVCDAKKLGMVGIVEHRCILAAPYATAAEKLVVVDLTDGSRTDLPLEGTHSVGLCEDRLVLSAGGEAFGLALDPRVTTFRTPGVIGIATPTLGRAFLGPTAGIVDASDGAVLVADPTLDRAEGRFPHFVDGVGERPGIVAWSSRSPDRGAVVYGCA